MEVNGNNQERAKWRERERLRVREEMLHAAAEVFARSGYAKASMKEIAAQVGISVGMLYNYFRGKEEIFRELIEHYINHLREKADASYSPDDPPVEKILSRIRSAVDFYWENRNLAMMYFSENPLRLEIVVKGWEKQSRSILSELLSEAMERGDLVREDPTIVATLIVGAIHRLAYVMVKEGNENALSTIPDIIHRLVLKPLERPGVTEEENI